MSIRRLGLVALGLLSAWASDRSARAQGLIVDRRPGVPIARSCEVREVRVDARVRDQVAEVRVSQTFHNPGSTTIESEYLFPLPEEGAIRDLVLMVDGKEMPGRLLPKDEARRIYEEIVRRKRDPALLEYMGRGLYRTSVFPIPPGADRVVTMTYTQLLRRDRDVVEFAYPFGTQKFTAKPIGRLTLDLDIRSGDPIKSVYSPSDDVSIRREGDHQARVTLERRHVVPSNDFRLVYTLAEGAVGASVLSYRPDGGEDGYFLLLASPKVEAPDERPRPKTVVFVLDRSGSMAGKKIEQARGALKFVLNNLREGDTFNIIAYDDGVDAFKPELQRYDSGRRAEAERYVDNIREGGSTNIDAALRAALGMIPDADDRPAYVLFLTDGLPTAGETGELAIAGNAKKANEHDARVFAFGVGHDVNARLLDRLSGGNGGTSEYVKPDEDIERVVGRFYSRLTAPALTGLSVEIDGTDLNRTYPRDLPDLFDGGQLVWVGRYTRSGPARLRLRGKVGGESRSFEFPVELARPGEEPTHAYVETLWAVRRIGHIIDQIDLHGPNRELTDELVTLSTRHGILTPYTSFLADEGVQLHAGAENRRRADRNLLGLREVGGSFGVAQRGAKQAYNQAERLSDAASLATAPALAPATAAGPRPGAMGRGGMMGSGAMARSATAGQAAPEAETVRRVGSKTFYRRDGRWIDAEVKPEDEAKAVVIEPFTDAYFDLARGQSAEQNRYLGFEEGVTVALGGKVYRIEPARR